MKYYFKYFSRNCRPNIIFWAAKIILLQGISFFILTLSLEGKEIKRDTIFDKWDKNGDNKLQLDELPPNARPNFNKADQNNDGTISREEDKAFRNRSKRNNNFERPAQSSLIKIKQNIFYTKNENLRQSLDLLIPQKRKKEKLPVIVYIHGGAWKAGNKNQGQRHLSAFVESGHYIGVSVGYRLSSESKWPSQIHDCKAAIRWIRGNAKEYGMDTTKIGAIGHSAGGHLVSMLGTTSGVKALEGSLGQHTNESSKINCVINFFGPSAFLEMSKFPSRIDHDAENSPESQLIGGALQSNKKKALQASPIYYASKDDVPFLHIHGTNDQLVPYNQSVIFNKKLLEKGCSSTLITIKGGGHGGFKDEKIKDLSQNFFAKHLRHSEFDIKAQTIKQSNSTD